MTAHDNEPKAIKNKRKLKESIFSLKSIEKKQRNPKEDQAKASEKQRKSKEIDAFH